MDLELQAQQQVDVVTARHTLRSARLLVHTDLQPTEAHALLARLEQVLDESSDYWRRPATGLIECYVIDDLKNWPEDAIPHPMVPLVVDKIGGITLVGDVGAGIQSRKKVTVLATSRYGVAEHEVVHAYCGQTFGVTGPAWYREGIAQVFAYGFGEDNGVHCPEEFLAQFKSGRPKPLPEIVRGGAFAQRLASSLVDKLNRHEDLAGLIPIGAWSESDVRELDQLKEAYAWSWLACHLLYHNPNYQARFKSLGQAYLARQEETFGELFTPVMKELAFEYEFTIRHLDIGYRVDLCCWEWDKRFRCAEHGRSISARIAAARGYQASGLRVTGGQKYRFKARGTWSTAAQSLATSADGDAYGFGRLDGVVMHNYQLSESFSLGARGEFQAPSDGLLYLRCRDYWSQLDDNEGSVVVAFTRAK